MKQMTGLIIMDSSKISSTDNHLIQFKPMSSYILRDDLL